MGIGTFGNMLPHWPSAGWWTGSLAVVPTALKKIAQPGQKGVRWRSWCVAGAATGFVMTCVLYLILLLPIIRTFYNGPRSASLDLHRDFPAVKPLRAYRPK